MTSTMDAEGRGFSLGAGGCGVRFHDWEALFPWGRGAYLPLAMVLERATKEDAGEQKEKLATVGVLFTHHRLPARWKLHVALERGRHA